MYKILSMHSSSHIESYALLMIKNIISLENYIMYHVCMYVCIIFEHKTSEYISSGI